MPVVFGPHSVFAAPPSLDETRWTRGRTLCALLAGVALLLAAICFWPAQSRRPQSLDEVHLGGARGPACLRLVLANDVSGSMSKFSSARQAAVTEFLRWAPRNLRDDDELGVLDFALTAAWERQPVRITTTGTVTWAPAVDGTWTLLEPVLKLVAALPNSRCDTQVLLLSDAQLADLPTDAAEGRSVLVGKSVHGVSLLVPGQSIQVPTQWLTAFPEAGPHRFNGANAAQTGLAFADVIAQLTGQRLDKR